MFDITFLENALAFNCGVTQREREREMNYSELLDLLGAEQGRLRLEWISSAEGTRFAEVATEFTEQIKALGPSHLKKVA